MLNNKCKLLNCDFFSLHDDLACKKKNVYKKFISQNLKGYSCDCMDITLESLECIYYQVIYNERR